MPKDFEPGIPGGPPTPVNRREAMIKGLKLGGRIALGTAATGAVFNALGGSVGGADDPFQQGREAGRAEIAADIQQALAEAFAAGANFAAGKCGGCTYNPDNPSPNPVDPNLRHA